LADFTQIIISTYFLSLENAMYITLIITIKREIMINGRIMAIVSLVDCSIVPDSISDMASYVFVSNGEFTNIQVTKPIIASNIVKPT
jgi:hypothetical protein